MLKRIRDELWAWRYRRELKQLNEALDKCLVEAKRLQNKLDDLSSEMRWS